MKKIYVIITLLAALSFMHAMAQKTQFYNLTADQLKVDSLLPHVGCTYDLPLNHADSVYEVALKYLEYYDLSPAEVEAYKRIEPAIPAETPVIDVNTVYSRKHATLVADFCPVVFRNGKYQFVVSYMTEITARPAASQLRGKALAAADMTARYAAESVLAKGRWAKISVTNSGVYQLTSSVVKKAGFSDISKVKIYGYGGNLVPEVLTPEYLADNDDLMEVPQCIVDGKHYFYGKGPVSWELKTSNSRTRNPYSNYGYYFITESEGAPLTVNEEQFIAVCNMQPENYHWLYEKDEFAWMEGGRNLYEKKAIRKGEKAEYEINVAPGNETGYITVCNTGDTRGQIEVSLNGNVLGTQNISIGSYYKANSVVTTYSVQFSAGENKVVIANKNIENVHLDYIDVRFTTPNQYTSLASGNFPEASYVHNITNQNLHGDSPVDLVIIIPTNQRLLSQATRLKEMHEQHDGLRVRIVPADELYNEFSSGTPDMSAYKRYMKMLYDRAETEADAPRYLLLFGDGFWDNRLCTFTSGISPDSYLLCYESENSYSETNCYTTDDFTAMLDDGEALGGTSSTSFLGIPDIGVGRLPVVTQTEAQNMVDKILHYVNDSPSGAWQNTLVFLGDDGNQNLHMADEDALADSIIAHFPGYYSRKIMWDAYSRVSSSTGHRYPDISTDIKKQQNNGALIIDYAGHGAPKSISHELVLTLPDFEEFRGDNYSLWVTASCDIMPYDGNAPSIGETAILNPRGGSVAFYGTARTVMSNYNKHINYQFMHYVLSNDENGRPLTLGDANRLAKKALVEKSLDRTCNKLQYALLGDPAMRLARPQYGIVIDSINGQATDSDVLPQMPAGSIARVVGHVTDGNQRLDNFNGLASIIVRDSEEKVVCKLNDTTSDGATTAFDFMNRANVLYQGSDSVRNGQFSFVFAVPMDINYSEKTSLMNVYAYNMERTAAAHGAFDRFVVNGSQIAPNDSVGPSIYCYLNSENFANGGIVNQTPYFVAEIKDADGINASGAGIGHDMQLTIDGLSGMTYSLNDYFQFDFGSYKSGKVNYSIPTLAPGQHTLSFRAWDMLNNPSTTTLSFVVQESLNPAVSHIMASPNPASDSVMFVVNHDRPGSKMNVIIDVMDASGRLLWSYEDELTASSSSYTTTWNLCLANGLKLQTGVYLYRVRVKSEGSDYTSLAKKLIVLRK